MVEDLKYKLSIAELQIVLDALAEQPFKKVHEVIATLLSQHRTLTEAQNGNSIPG